jgi:putative nucleotidyltransferase with HDIG domain
MNEFDYRWNIPQPSGGTKLPGAVQEIVRLVNEPKTSVARLAAAVARHQTLAESVLRKANISAYGLPGRIKNLNSAVVVLGFDALKETSRGVLLASTGKKITRTVIENEDLWEHAIGCAIIAKTLAVQSGKCNPDSAFLAGLLHDIGAVFVHPVERGIRNTTRMTVDRKLEAPAMDSSVRYLHAQAGAEKAQSWHVPMDVVEAIRYHHLPRLASRNRDITNILHLAEYVTHALRVGTAPFEEVTTADEAALTTLGMNDVATLEQLVARIKMILSDVPPDATRLIESTRTVKSTLFGAIDSLAEEQRLVMALHYYEELGVEEIAQLLEVPTAAVVTRLRDAVAHLQQAAGIAS